MRPLVTADLPDIVGIERESYPPELRESEAAFLSKMAVFRAGALGCWDEAQLCGYAFALPWTAGALVGVAQIIDQLPPAPDVLYLHDMVVAPARRRMGVASRLFGEIRRLAGALHLPHLSLVAVQGSEPFWQRLGFAPIERIEYVPGIAATRMGQTLPLPAPCPPARPR